MRNHNILILIRFIEILKSLFLSLLFVSKVVAQDYSTPCEPASIRPETAAASEAEVPIEEKTPLNTDQSSGIETPNSDTIRRDVSLSEGQTCEDAIAATNPEGQDPAEAKSEDHKTRDPMLLYDNHGLEVRAHIQAGLNIVGERNLFWNLSDTFAADAAFNPDTDWLELYAKPGLSFKGILSNDTSLYGKVSTVVSGTLGTDAYDTGDTGRILLEEGYLGLRTQTSEGINLDFSVGPRELKLGSGMLISNGASNGFERGALKLGPRKAWEFAASATIAYKDFTSKLFYLNPRELASNNSNTSLAGIDLRYDRPNQNYIGLTYANILDSNSAYPQAALGGIGAPTIIPEARSGLNVTNLYTRVTPFKGKFAPLFLTLDAAYEWNNRINLSAWAGRVQAGYTFKNLPLSPTLTYSYQTFSGDDPNTGTLERFDPLFYEGSPSSWATGSKSATVFINSNVQAHQLALRLLPSVKDTVTLRYAHIRANQLNSPVQFGQATRFDFSNGAGVVSGVNNSHLADDFFLEYNRVLNRNTFWTTGFSVSLPGAGIRATVDQDTPLWYGWFTNIVVNF
ncbi:alginate export family protein [Lyngbya confervoides]|uniref:Alginate export family protein n=1 Tax=Lyngbya confervoides BDU141951 TaxID=1574623 RepID=A0ABD4T9F8_9CYAN|nr:alginate export family protein [Lyngbya confervoides]MCM1984965.1 alginate export family protein [Lyngbya confervoides BDU141951]